MISFSFLKLTILMDNINIHLEILIFKIYRHAALNPGTIELRRSVSGFLYNNISECLPC
ncbi:hypothetical protein THOM_2551 [Trachipleistophora hominis]|uniref:Uncharacterized protein n=1 Tax=Trachipleistophora hominis TaxID=72359 RepID=L7JTZ8_TRAHO|nr:hypothetical protein THOM_2551 [Trachipleistophora hominis]